MCWIADYCNGVKTLTSARKFWSLLENTVFCQLYCSSLWGFHCSKKPRTFFFYCVQMFTGACQERLRWNLLLCCWGVGAPLGLSVLVLWFPASQHFAGGLRGDTGGTYDWAAPSWASRSYRSAADASFWRPSVSPLSAPSSAWWRTWQRAGCSLSPLVSTFRCLTCQS